MLWLGQCPCAGNRNIVREWFCFCADFESAAHRNPVGGDCEIFFVGNQCPVNLKIPLSAGVLTSSSIVVPEGITTMPPAAGMTLPGQAAAFDHRTVDDGATPGWDGCSDVGRGALSAHAAPKRMNAAANTTLIFCGILPGTVLGRKTSLLELLAT